MTAGSSVTISSKEVGIIVIKSTFDAPFASFTYQNVQMLNNAEYVGIMIGASVGYFIILLIIVIFVTRWVVKRRLRAMQSPNIVYFLKKKVL
jgi:hypothetical protein